MLACVIFEDEHLLVVNKPAGVNTHAPGPFAGEGIYEWLRCREPRWASLAIVHRLDKETSGVIVFGKTAAANRSLTEQFTQHAIRKKYVLLTDRAVPKVEFTVKSSLVRVGEKYVSRPLHAGSEIAETKFGVPVLVGEGRPAKGGTRLQTVVAEPITGRTHQIRVHAAHSGFPIFGDTLYGGTPTSRVCLHAAELTLKHPVTNKEMTFQVTADFDSDSRLELRRTFVDPDETNAFRVIHGASDGWPGWCVDRLGDYLLSQGENPLTQEQSTELERLMKMFSSRGAYHKSLTCEIRQTTLAEASPQLVLGEAAPERFVIRENGVQFEMSYTEGYSVGLFLDQRDNRRRLLTGHIAPGFPLFNSEIRNPGPEILNTFAYTCGFSVCAALAGARVTSLDLSKKYLDWGKRNFVLNNLDPAAHDFIFGDTFDWLRRLAKKGRMFDTVILDPPTFSQSKEGGTFRAEKDYGKLVTTALTLVRPGGVLLGSTNAAGWPPEEFMAGVEASIRAAKRKIVTQHYAPQPPDFPVNRAEPAYLKTAWMRVV
jgi:23S rRNA (cytosine1962-C5)-methyltransferase